MACTVNCAKLGQELPGIERAPMRGELGQRIYDTISQRARKMWREQATFLINHDGLTLADPQPVTCHCPSAAPAAPCTGPCSPSTNPCTNAGP